MFIFNDFASIKSFSDSTEPMTYKVLVLWAMITMCHQNGQVSVFYENTYCSTKTRSVFVKSYIPPNDFTALLNSPQLSNSPYFFRTLNMFDLTLHSLFVPET